MKNMGKIQVDLGNYLHVIEGLDDLQANLSKKSVYVQCLERTGALGCGHCYFFETAACNGLACNSWERDDERLVLFLKDRSVEEKTEGGEK